MANAVGRLAEAYTGPSNNKTTDLGFSYTARGEIADVYEKTSNSGAYYHATQSYWASGAPYQLSGISGIPTITYYVDGEGRPSTVGASSGQNPITSVSYNTASLPTAVTFGSSDSDSFSFDSNTFRMSQYQFNVNGSSATGSFTWNSNGSLAGLNISDALNSLNTQNCSYSHDDLSRIASVSCGSTWAQTFSFDPFGNISKSGSISFAGLYDTSTNRLTNMGKSYDSNGNLTGISSDAIYGYSWDAEGKPVSITRSGSTVNLTYDALGRMVEQNRGGSYTQIVYGPGGAKLALMSGSTLQKAFVPLPAGAQAVYNASGLAYYRHADWLGSSRLASTPSRTIYYDGGYAPYGESEQTTETGTTDHMFTGQNEDTHPGLYDFMYREYHPVSGRWSSPDPAGLAAVDPSNPQSWNRYAYVTNNPLNAIDPLGLDAADPILCELFGMCGGGGGGGGGGRTDPCKNRSYAIMPSCDPDFNPNGPLWNPPFPPIGGGGVGSGGGGGGTGGTNGSSSGPNTGGLPPMGGETNGIPNWLPAQPLSMCQLIGLCPIAPGCDFGVCVGVGNGVVAAAAPLAVPCLASGVCAVVVGVGTVAIIAYYYGPQILQFAQRGRGNVADTGIEDEARRRFPQLDMCSALAQMMQEAQASGETAKCRESRRLKKLMVAGAHDSWGNGRNRRR